MTDYERLSREYKINQLKNATDLEALVMLYKEAIFELERGKELFEKKNDDFKKHINKARTIVRGLVLLLDFEKGKEIAQNLYALYNYMDKRMVVAEFGVFATPRYCDEIVEMLHKLLESWEQLAAEEVKQREEQPPSPQINPASGGLEITI